MNVFPKYGTFCNALCMGGYVCVCAHVWAPVLRVHVCLRVRACVQTTMCLIDLEANHCVSKHPSQTKNIEVFQGILPAVTPALYQH